MGCDWVTLDTRSISGDAFITVIPILMPYGKIVQLIPIVLPLGHEQIHHRHKPGVVAGLDHVREFMQ